MTRSKPLAERFWPKVQITPGCWTWTAAQNGRGYGYIGKGPAGAGALLAHRISYEMHHGPIPKGMLIRHKCDNPPCVNPDHLELGTVADNSRDMVERGRSTVGLRNARAVLTPRQIDEIRALRGVEFQRITAERYGITQAHVSNIQIGKRRSVA